MQNNAKLLFEEKQRMNQWWLMLSMAFPLIMVVVFAYNDWKKGSDLSGSLGAVLLVLASIVLVRSFNLVTRVYEDRIAIKYFPFINIEKSFYFSDLQSIFIRKYKPLTEYGGWGFKGTKKNRAYNVTGNKGLQLQLHDRKVLIGTQKEEELEMIIHNLEMQGKFKINRPLSRQDKF